jgi:hypothetical protein
LAPADTEAIDLSGITHGIPLEISLRELTDVRLTPLLSKVTKTVDALHVKQLLVAPPGSTRSQYLKGFQRVTPFLMLCGLSNYDLPRRHNMEQSPKRTIHWKCPSMQ